MDQGSQKKRYGEDTPVVVWEHVLAVLFFKIEHSCNFCY